MPLLNLYVVAKTKNKEKKMNSIDSFLNEKLGMNTVPTVPTKLYHITPAKNIEKIKKEGLKPTASKSSLLGIFLSDDKFTAQNYASMYRDDSEFFVLTINGSLLNPNKIVPDNYEFPDLLSQMTDKEQEKYDLSSWVDSLKVCSQIAYTGIITPNMITKWEKYEN